MRVATDVGGTFTDIVCMVDGQIRSAKTDTTPPDFERGVMAAVDKLGVSPRDFDFFAHGTTVVINALLARKGAKTALITTRGFRDVLEIARGNRPDLFNFTFDKPRPFVPRHLRCEISERVDYRGQVLQAVALDELPAIVTQLKAEGVEAIAICLLHAYVNASHEERVRERLQVLWPEVSLIASHEVCREWREYERSSTAVLSAYVHPIAKRYLSSLETQMKERGLPQAPFIMQSNGGITTIRGAQNNPISMVESGPASGVLGAAALGRLIDEPRLIALDIGGTTAKTALIDGGQARITTEYKIEWSRTSAGYPIRTAVVDLVEIGNGGGSIAWIDEGQRLHVGPQSAGAQPGPAAYGRGGQDVTTTDANLLLGRINPKLFLGGAQEPDMAGVRRIFGALAEKLGGSAEDVARGVIRIANANMVNALKLVSLNRGYDPREFALIAFGGGGAMHACSLAAELRVRKVIIPVNSSVFSAWGMLMSDLRRDFLQTQVERLARMPVESVRATYGAMHERAVAQCVTEGMPQAGLRVERFADMRYQGQEHTVKVAFPDGAISAASIETAIERFHEEHKREFSFRLDNDVELVNYHVVVIVEVAKQALPERPRSGAIPASIQTGVRTIDFDVAGRHDTPAYDWERFEPEMQVNGPAVIEDASATLLLPPGQQARMDRLGNLHVMSKETS